MDIRRAMDPRKVLRAYYQMTRSADAGGPFSIEIQPTDLCNYGCTYCSYQLRRQVRAHLPNDTLQRLCDDVVDLGVQSVYFAGGGEPTLHTLLPDCLEYLHQHEVHLSLVTNGSLLTERLTQRIANCLDYALIHIASTDGSLYHRLMNHDMGHQLDLPRRLKAVNPQMAVGARIVVTDVNVTDVRQSIQALVAADFDYVLCTPVRDFEGLGLSLSGPSVETLMQTAKEEPLFQSGQVMVADFRDPGYSPASRCWSLHFGLVAIVDPKGDVFTCLPDVGNPDRGIGNVNAQSLRSIWASEQKRRIEDRANKRYVSGACANCRCIAYNPHVENAVAAELAEHKLFI